MMSVETSDTRGGVGNIESAGFIKRSEMQIYNLLVGATRMKYGSQRWSRINRTSVLRMQCQYYGLWHDCFAVMAKRLVDKLYSH
jgi:hypothetical protein